MQGASCPACLPAGVSGVGGVTGKGWARAGTRAGLGFLAWRSGVAVFRVGRESRVGRAERRCGGGFGGAHELVGLCWGSWLRAAVRAGRCGLGGALLELAEVGDG